MRYSVAPEVEAELDQIWYYLAQESGSVEIATRQVAAITSPFLLLAEHPYIGRNRDDLRPGLRSFPSGEYIILYRVDNEQPVILHVLHGRRDIQSFFG